MSIIGAIASTALIGWILIEAFEAMVLPRRVTRKFRLNRWFYRLCWPVWQLLSGAFRSAKRRETFLSVFGPLQLPPLFSEKTSVDNWQTSAWMRRTPGFRHLPVSEGDEHFD